MILGLQLLTSCVVGVGGHAALQLFPPSFSATSLSSNKSRWGRKVGGDHQAVPGAQIVLLHRAVLVALVTGTVHFIVTSEGKKITSKFLTKRGEGGGQDSPAVELIVKTNGDFRVLRNVTDSIDAQVDHAIRDHVSNLQMERKMFPFINQRLL